MVRLRRYLNRKIYFNLEGDGAISGRIIKEGINYYFIPRIDSSVRKEEVRIPLTARGKNRVAFKDGVLEKKIRKRLKPKL